MYVLHAQRLFQAHYLHEWCRQCSSLQYSFGKIFSLHPGCMAQVSIDILERQPGIPVCSALLCILWTSWPAVWRRSSCAAMSALPCRLPCALQACQHYCSVQKIHHLSSPLDSHCGNFLTDLGNMYASSDGCCPFYYIHRLVQTRFGMH